MLVVPTKWEAMSLQDKFNIVQKMEASATHVQVFIEL
jgi:hypothetical protein